MGHYPFSRTRCACASCVVLLVWAAACVAVLSMAAPITGDIVIFNPMVMPSTQPPEAKRAYDGQTAGLLAALHNAKYTAVNERTIKLVEATNPDDLETSLQEALTTYGDRLLLTASPLLTDQIEGLQNSEVFADKNLTMFNPYSSGFAIRRWTKSLYFTSADPSTELLALLLYLLSELRVRRVGFMYLTGIGMGEDELEVVKEQLSSAGLDTDQLSIYVQPYTVTDTTYNQAAFDAFADTDPQAILYYASPGLHSLALCQALLSDPRTAGTYLLTPSMLLDLTFQCAGAQIEHVKEDQIIMSSTTVLASQTEYLHVQEFQTEMRACIEDGACPQFTTDQGNIFLEDPSLGQMLLYSWIGGKVLMQTLMRQDYVQSREAFQAGIFQINTAYMVGGDLLLGSYGGECPAALLDASNAQCECNQGGRAAYLKSITVTDGAIMFNALPQHTFTYSNFKCYSRDAFTVPDALGMLVLDVEDDPRLRAIAAATIGPVKDIARVLNAQSSATSLLSAHLLQGTTGQFDSLLDDEVKNYISQVVIGPIPDNFPFATTSLTVLDPMEPTDAPARNDTNAIYLFPTAEQQTFVIYSNMHNASMQGLVDRNEIYVIFKNVSKKHSDSIVNTISLVARTFELPEAGSKYVAAGESMAPYMTASGTYIIIGADEDDIDAIVAYLTKFPSALIIFCVQDFNRLFTTIMQKFATADPTVMARAMTLTNMPIWTYDDAHTTSPMARAFHAATTERTPIAFKSFIEMTFLNAVMAGRTSGSVADAVYRAGTITVNGMVFGPFVQSCSGAIGAACTPTNYGATSIATVSVLGLLSPEVGYSFDPMTPSMTYADPAAEKKGGLSKGAIIGIVVGCVAAVAGAIALIVVLLCCCGRSSRDNNNAPKALEYPVTLIFTDIESSTALWAACPTIMPDAVATHHKIIRQLIASYKCYEVKTIGDSFMIACKDPNAAVCLARDIQIKFLKHDWKAPEIDDAYRSFENRKAEELDNYAAPTAKLSPDVYESMWNGLRVRIGIHTGLSDIRQDETTQGFDYYGETSNMAARTEAIGNGGQVVLTESTWWALSDEERDLFECRNMGPQGLRGVPFNVEMYQLNAVVGRRYAALRTEIEAILPDNESLPSADGTETLLSSAGTLTGPAANIAFVLTNTFAPYPAPRRIKELTPLMEKWSVGVPPRSSHVSEEDYCRGLINRLAMKMSTVVQMRNNIAGGRMSNRLSVGGGRVGTYNVLSPTQGAGARALSADTRTQSSELTSDKIASLGKHRGSSIQPLAAHRLTANSAQSTGLFSPVGDSVVDLQRPSTSTSATAGPPFSMVEDSPLEQDRRNARQQRRTRHAASTLAKQGAVADASPDEIVLVRMPAAIVAREEAEEVQGGTHDEL